MPYTIGFENEPTADAPAQVVSVTQHLDPGLDWSTFQLGDFGFGGQLYPVPAGLTSYRTRIDARSTAGVYVDVAADLDKQTGVVTWTFTSIDPTTFDVPVGNPLEGFLPPDADSVEGRGFVSYSILPKASDTTGTVINAKATVTFQAGLPGQSSLDTAPTVNTIDAPPTGSVTALPAFSPGTFLVNWSGTDDAGGSGIVTYDVYVSDDDDPFTLWQSATAQTSATYTGRDGHTYRFYSIATDNVGNVQPTPAAAQATTEVDAVAPTSTVTALPATEEASRFAVTWSGQDNPGGSGITSFSVFVSDDGGPFQPLLTDTTQTSATFTGVQGHTYGFYSVATDKVGNLQATPAGAQASTTVQAHTTPQVTVNPVNLTYGTALDDAQLKGTATATVNGQPVPVDGMFTYTSADGTLLSAGNGQKEDVTFAPTDTSVFSSVMTTVVVNVAQATPSFTGLSSPTIAYGTASTTISGQLQSNSAQPVPAGETVKVTLNGMTQNASLQSNGDFFATFATGSLTVAGSTYAISFSYAGDANFQAATASSTLTVTPANISSQIRYTASGLVYNRATQLFGGTITLTNTGTTTLTGTLEEVFTGLPTGVTLSNASGTTTDGNPYILVALPGSGLAPGASVTFTVLYYNPKHLLFGYSLTSYEE
jgi:hypothetical protein